MRHVKYILRLFAVALLAPALLAPDFPNQSMAIAAAGHQPAIDDDNDDDTGDSDERRGRRRRDPCRKALKRAEKGKPLSPECEPNSSGGVAKGDFNGDGFGDLAVGVPFEDEDFVGSVGAVNVIYGSATGLTSAGDQYLTELTFGYPYATDDRFGAALASGDFNGDGYSDLAIGMPGRERFGRTNHGVVLLIDGSTSGLIASTARTLELINDRGGAAGAALVWADFNGDGFGDLAVGIPERDFFASFPFPDALDAGEVQVFYGSSNSLTKLGAQHFNGGRGDRYGSPLAAGDFNSDGAADLVVGVPFENNNGSDDGSVDLFPGGPNGLRLAEGQFLSQATAGVGGAAESGDQFGFALAVGDFNADLRDDLAVGVPGEDLAGNAQADAGAVQVFFGNPFPDRGLVDAAGALYPDLFITQSTLGKSVEADDRFGRALASGKFNGDFHADLAIGSPGENVGSTTDAGMASVVYGSLDGLSFASAQHWHQNIAGIPDDAEAGDEFGRALSAWNYGKSSHSDLAIGVPFEDLLSTNTNTQQADAGAVHLIYGTATGLSAAGNQFWHQDVPGIASAASAGDRFGVTLY